MFRYNKHAARTEFNAESATFTAFLDDMDDAVGNPNAIPIQGLPPIFHNVSFNANGSSQGLRAACNGHVRQDAYFYNENKAMAEIFLYHNWV